MVAEVYDFAREGASLSAILTSSAKDRARIFRITWPRCTFKNQAIPIPPVADAIEEALKRGVEVVILVPAQPEPHVREARCDPSRRLLFDREGSLGQYERFSLVGIAAMNGEGARRDIYVHGKIMLVDDEWATIGSCNLHSNSLSGHTEMNASIWDATVVRPLRCELLSEHLGQDTGTSMPAKRSSFIG